MTEYFKRLIDNSKTWERVLWWIIRIAMIAGTIESFVHYDKYEDKIRTMMIGNTCLTFGWELFQLFPEKHMFRHLPSYTQNFTSIYIFLTAFMGAYINFYYKVWWWDTTLHFVSGCLLVFAGFTFMKAYEDRDKIELPVAVVVLAAFSISFMFGTLWECWEFSFDQMNMHAAEYGDTQHWSYEYAQQIGPARLDHLIFQPWFDKDSPLWQARFALMDTMTDTVANTLGACIGGIALKLGLRKKEKAQKAAKKLAKETASAK